MAMLKKQLDEREKQLAAEQEDASAVKNRLRELTKVRHRRVSKTAGLLDSLVCCPVRLLLLIIWTRIFAAFKSLL